MGTKTKKDVVRDRANAYVEPIITATRDVFGSRTKLMELLSKRLRKPVSRHRITRWLRDEPANREQPLLGIGLILREVFDANRVYILQPWNAAKRRKPRGKNKQKTKGKMK
jgi:hypothetical protein